MPVSIKHLLVVIALHISVVSRLLHAEAPPGVAEGTILQQGKGNIRSSLSIQEVAKLLRSKHSEERVKAALLLTESSNEARKTSLLQRAFTSETTPGVRLLMAACILRRGNDGAAAHFFRRMIFCSEPADQVSAINLLSIIGDRDYFDSRSILRALIFENNPQVSRRAGEVLLPLADDLDIRLLKVAADIGGDSENTARLIKGEMQRRDGGLPSATHVDKSISQPQNRIPGR